MQDLGDVTDPGTADVELPVAQYHVVPIPVAISIAISMRSAPGFAAPNRSTRVRLFVNRRLVAGPPRQGLFVQPVSVTAGDACGQCDGLLQRQLVGKQR